MRTPKKTTSARTTAPRLKNYTTEATEEELFQTIQSILVAHKAKRILLNLDDQGRATAIEFAIKLGGTMYQYRLPARFELAEPLVADARKTMHQGATSGEALKNQTYRTVWATIRDWLSASMALIAIESSRFEEVFLPYLLVDADKTLFEEFAEQRALPPPARVIITESE